MTLAEFKAWLEGYEEAFVNEKPSLEQWQRIKEKLALVRVLAPQVYAPNDLSKQPTYKDLISR